MLKNSLSRREIVVGLVSSVIFAIFVQPILTLTWNMIVILSNNIYLVFMQDIYRSIARPQQDSIDLMIFIYVSMAVSFIVLLMARINLLEQDIYEISTGKHTPNASRIKRYGRFMLAVALFSIVAIFIGIVVPNFAKEQYLRSFQQRMTVLAPYITEQQEEEVRAKWAMMKDRDDYLAVNQILEQLASQHNIVLPENIIR